MKAVVIGGGIIGNSVAWRLAREGIAVTVFERGRLGREASWAAAGMIAPQAEAQEPGVFFDLCLHARTVFENTVERLIAESGVDPEYDHAGILYVALNAAERAHLEDRARWQRKAGATVEELDAAQARKLEPAISPEIGFALHLPDNRRTDNRKLTQAYANAAIRSGARLIEGAAVDEVVTNGRGASGVRLHDGARHDADIVINTAGSWAGEIHGLEADHVKLHPIRGQILCFETRPGALGPAVFSTRGYVVPRRDGRLLAGSTMEEAGYDKSVTLGGMEKIVRGTSEMMPSLAATPFREAWAGLRPATKDLLPVLGASPSLSNVFYATGHFRSGILLSALTGEIIADLIKGRQPSIDLAPFSPARFAGDPR
ncbi:MAG: glycine oxidase ThiO [Candidatus Binataceae bacterium]